ncbi:Similar to S.cerevisiae protein STP22 (Component of the ESCRT-I complex) [Malassezia sympodialis ATCC 42132]|uniref:Similar to S.cerevisiae protein STP22 (Component of the ESCRT-I complex) n=1 Tax=Malassezia sympodialis (strain ATCC 42132) TaxID=1230383 RepID=A0A1M8A9M6_MALS4|nr:Similar to S.cerevisiae protein STP22 (Component of the ESCRT-I complex) [Malassezia sympodialis ATCC 42132]
MNDVVHRWLDQVLAPYAERARIMRDMEHVLTEYHTLRPRTDMFTYDDGRCVLLLLLDGTLPVPFRGQVYQIPVHVWIPRAYPAEPPIVYVAPTQNMVVCRGSCVGPDGRVRLPYMDAWERKPEGTSLTELLRECQTVFHLEPPVMAKHRENPARASPAPGTSAADGAPPARPPKASSAAGPPAAPSPPPAAPERPPKPAPPAAAEERAAPTPTPPRPVNPGIAELQARVHAKLSRSVAETQDAVNQAMEHLERLCGDLERGRPAMDDEMQRLRVVRDLCMVDAERLDATIQQAQQQTAELQARADPDVDHMLCPTSIAENQLLQLMAEDLALEDTLYQLGRALYADQLPLDRFLKHARILSRDQFMKRALAQKIAAGLGWPTSPPTRAPHSSSARE